MDQGYVGQPNKIHMKYELGVSENQFEAKTRQGQGDDQQKVQEFWHTY